MAAIAIVGGGFAGMVAALYLAKQGHEITVYERDGAPPPPSAAEAFDWDRKGAPQVRHSHAMLARLRNLLMEDHPEVYRALIDAGATEMRLYDDMPRPDGEGGIEEADREIVMLACRRATLEWVMRSAVQATGKVNFLSGVTVSGLLVSDDPERRIRGLQLAGGEEHLADIVVVADGRRSGLPKWLKAVGIALDDDVEEPAGIQYFSRFYRLDDGVDFPTTSLVANDLGYLFYAAFCGDNGHFSLALSANDDDDELRHALQDPAHYENAVRQIPELQPWINSGTPVTGIFPMAGLINRRRHFVRDGKPVLAGLHVIGDAHIATNPAYGRGLSLAIWQARLLSDAVAVEPTDLGRQSALFCEAVQEHIVPWFDISVMMDSSRREERERKLAEGDAHAAVDNPMKSLADAANVDPQVWRTFWRVMNLLEPPETLMAPEFIERIMEVVGNLPEPAPASEVLPPVRTEMLSALGFSGH